ncbi:MAG: host attachment protein [Nannocystaceae bacterium]
MADKSRATLYKNTDDGLGTVREFDHPAARAHTGDLMTGHRGRRRDQAQAGPRSAMERQTPVQETEVVPFAKEICDWLHNQEARNAFSDLFVVAEPEMLGFLRDHVDTHANLEIAGSLDKNLTHESASELRDRLRTLWPESVM